MLSYSVGATERPDKESLFQKGNNAYAAGEYTEAAGALRQSGELQPASGTLLNLGNAEWQRGKVGPAILAWEQSAWLDPFARSAQNNLKFSRKVAQVEAPDLAWHEAVSSWLPANWWAWITGLSLWTAVGMAMLPGILRLPKAPWHQAIAAVGLAVFLLSLPALLGVHTRTHLGFVLQQHTPLRLTPTEQSQFITTVGAGDPARLERRSKGFLLIRTSRTKGWVHESEFGLIVARKI